MLAHPVAAPLELELAFGKALRADQNLPGNPDQVGGGEFRAGALIGVVVENVDVPGLELAIERLAGGVDGRITLLQVQDHGREGGDSFGHFAAGIVMAGLDVSYS